MRSGTVVICDFPGVVNTKKRPALVVSSEKYQRDRPDAILAVITGQISKSNSSTDYVLSDWRAANLKKQSAARMFLFTLPQYKLTEIGKLTEKDWAEVKKCLQIAFDFNE